MRPATVPFAEFAILSGAVCSLLAVSAIALSLWGARMPWADSMCFSESWALTGSVWLSNHSMCVNMSTLQCVLKV
jgi:hypothetical protein